MFYFCFLHKFLEICEIHNKKARWRKPTRKCNNLHKCQNLCEAMSQPWTTIKKIKNPVAYVFEAEQKIYAEIWSHNKLRLKASQKQRKTWDSTEIASCSIWAALKAFLDNFCLFFSATKWQNIFSGEQKAHNMKNFLVLQ